jgi:2-polyprenyl-3-methyl-5-hydroxy-6-metoxy-1,4-benzoquinol methylase
VSGLADGLDAFVATFDRRRLAERASALSQGEWSAGEFRTFIDTYLNEAKVGLDLVASHLSPEMRILEVGAGVGLLPAYLKQRGYEVMGIEPGAEGGFGFMPAIIDAVGEQIDAYCRPDILPIVAERLTPGKHGRFDLIFSVNVMEHVMALDDAVAAMRSVLTPRGRMVHLCPNYAFPYEPHLAIPLVPLVPHWTKRLFRSAVARNGEVWDAINFITAGRVRSMARANSLDVVFESGIMGRYFERARQDRIFGSRHPGLARRLASSRMLGAVISNALSHVPAALASPMVFTLTHAQE